MRSYSKLNELEKYLVRPASMKLKSKIKKFIVHIFERIFLPEENSKCYKFLIIETQIFILRENNYFRLNSN